MITTISSRLQDATKDFPSAKTKSMCSLCGPSRKELNRQSDPDHCATRTRTETEMIIALNGPAVQHSESIVKERKIKYWGDKKKLKDGHFVSKSMNIKSCIVSKTVDSRLLHPQHLDGIWIGQNQYRLPLAPLNEYPEPWC